MYPLIGVIEIESHYQYHLLTCNWDWFSESVLELLHKKTCILKRFVIENKACLIVKYCYEIKLILENVCDLLTIKYCNSV